MYADHFPPDPFRSDEFVGLRTIKQEMECCIRYPNTEKCNTSNARRSFCMWYPDNKKKHIKHDKRSFIWYPNTRRSVLPDIQTSRSNQTRKEVFHLISKHREVTYQSRGVFYLINKHCEVIYQTREEVFHLISKHREAIYQTREGVFHIYKSNTRKSVTSDNQTPRGDTPNTRSGSPDIETPKGNTSNTILYQASETRIK